jgi:hypothetical protein
MSINFWINEPSILLNKNYIFELWPTPKMCLNQKLNAITRLVLILSILAFVVTLSYKFLIIGIITIGVIFLLYNMQKSKITENFDSTMYVTNNNINQTIPLETAVKETYKIGNKINPFSNVLLTEISDDPNRKSAPPAFNPEIDEDIVRNTKKMVQHLNPGIKNTSKQLFGDLYNNFELDQSNRAFYSTANTKVANDQGAFADFCYGFMPSAKESNTDGNAQRIKDNLYTSHFNLY